VHLPHIANLTQCDPAAIATIELALKHKAISPPSPPWMALIYRRASAGAPPKWRAASLSIKPPAPTLAANWRYGRSSPAS